MQQWRQRTHNLNVETVEDSMVIYDRTTDEVVCLDERAAMIFRACTGLSASDIATQYGWELYDVEDHMAALAQNHLIEPHGSIEDPTSIERRTFIRTTAVAGATAVGVWCLRAPLPAAAASGGIKQSSG